LSAGCLDSLVYYQRLLVTLLGTDDDTRAERETLNLDSLDKLRRLERVDPMRGARYRDLGAHSEPMICGTIAGLG
jgi:geranylgeranyl transferase type-2 subunit alpha